MINNFKFNKKEQEKFQSQLKRVKVQMEARKREKIVPFRNVIVEGLPFAIICDIDGTLSNRGDRAPLDFEKVNEDIIHEPVKEILQDIILHGKHKIIIVSGRSVISKAKTIAWLKDNEIPFDEIYMRGIGDERVPEEVKREFYMINIQPRYNIDFAIEDDRNVKKMWVESGIFVFDVNQTN